MNKKGVNLWLMVIRHITYIILYKRLWAYFHFHYSFRNSVRSIYAANFCTYYIILLKYTNR